MDTFWLLAVTLLLILVQSLLYRLFGLRALYYHRAFTQKTAYVGDTVTLVEIIRNAKPLPMPWLRIESRISPTLRFGAQEDLEISADQYHKSVFFLGAFSQVTRRHTVHATHRGHFAVGSVALTTGDLLGAQINTLQLHTGACITVYPALLREDALDIPSSRWQGDLLVRRWIAQDPFLVSGIRDYQPGDMQRDIHWAATAHTGRLQVKTHAHTADPRLLVLLNVQTSENQWGDLMPYEQDVIEYGISLAATLCLRALQAGIEAGFAANAPVLDETSPAFLAPMRSPTQADALLDMLARLRIHRLRSFPSFLEELGTLSGLDLLILSVYDSALLQERMAALRAMGNTVALLRLGEEAPLHEAG